ncbi:hypothetical protein I4U23_005212 [Adineta vaga]|nr:hypothetical protein I4U23_005212 [Adineta vaga]
MGWDEMGWDDPIPCGALRTDTQHYNIVVTTWYADTTGEVSVIVSGPTEVILKSFMYGKDKWTQYLLYIYTQDEDTSNSISQKQKNSNYTQNHEKCYVGSGCNTHVKSIGVTLDDILRYEIKSNMSLNDQSLTVKISAVITMIMFSAGLINSVLSFLTFQNAELRTVGCGMYLLASSITSLLTICMLTVKYWFVLLTQMNTSLSLFIYEGGCRSIEPLLKLFLSLDGWLNGCVAIERAINVLKGVNFDKDRSKRIARWIIIILPLCIIASIIHEPLYREVFEYKIENGKGEEKKTERFVRCMTAYSHTVQEYNTAILFIHLIGPFIANLCSALIIMFGTARRKAAAQARRSFREHMRKQWLEHKQLLISPAILLVLSMPRLVISLLSGCVDASRQPWLFLCAYFISFIPSILIFVVFVVPSKLYMKTFNKTLESWRQCSRP